MAGHWKNIFMLTKIFIVAKLCGLPGVQDAELPVAEHSHQDAVSLAVVLHGGGLQDPLNVLEGQVVVNLHVEVELAEVDPEVVPVAVGAVPRVEVQPRVEVEVVEDECAASPPVVHVVLVRVLGGGHGHAARHAVAGAGPAAEPARVHSVVRDVEVGRGFAAHLRPRRKVAKHVHLERYDIISHMDFK